MNNIVCIDMDRYAWTNTVYKKPSDESSFIYGNVITVNCSTPAKLVHTFCILCNNNSTPGVTTACSVTIVTSGSSI